MTSPPPGQGVIKIASAPLTVIGLPAVLVAVAIGVTVFTGLMT